MLQVILGKHLAPGGRELYEDHWARESIQRGADLILHVGLVADGVGGQNRGERAAKLAVETALDVLRQSDVTNVPNLLRRAVAAAHQAVSRAGLGHNTSTTLAIAVIVETREGYTLYIVNVGDSRIYLVRDGELILLTLDHVYANVMPWFGEISRDMAQANTSAGALVYAVGLPKTIPADIGFYLETDRFEQATMLGERGLLLEENDTILICSDGFINGQTDQPYLSAQEIRDTLNEQCGEDAAHILVSEAVKRGPLEMDNTTLVTMQVLDPETRPASARYRVPRWMGFILGLLLLGLLTAGVGFALISRSNDSAISSLARLATNQAEIGQVAEGTIGALAQQATGTALAQTATAEYIAGFTATPTPTPSPTPTKRPTPIPNEIGAYFVGQLRQPFIARKPITATKEIIQISINDGNPDVLVDANFYTAENSILNFEDITILPGIELELTAGSDIFVNSGDYQEIEISLIDMAGITLYTMAADTCMSVNYQPQNLTVGCYRGACMARFNSQDTEVALGQQLTIDLGGQLQAEIGRIPRTTANHYQQLLARTAAGQQDYASCIRPLFPPLPTSTPTATATIPSPSPTRIQTTSTFVPPSTVPVQPSATPKPTTLPPTDTPVPPTDTPVPPTDTSVPPTDTSVPPTDTSVPPTTTTEPPAATPTDSSAEEPTPTNMSTPPRPTYTPEPPHTP